MENSALGAKSTFDPTAKSIAELMISTFKFTSPGENSLTDSVQKLQRRSPHLSPPPRHERSQPPQASQLDLLELLEKSLEPALRTEAVPVDVTVGVEQRFWVVHQQSNLRILGQFSYCEAQEILKVTALWDWTVDPRTREPACRGRLLSLLNRVCTPQKTLECAA